MSELRQDRLEARLGRIEETVARIDERLAATLPHLATKAEQADLRTELTSEIGKLRAEIADKPSRGYLWGVMAAMVGAQAVALAAAGLIFAFVAARAPNAPAPAPQHAVWQLRPWQ